MRAAAHWLWALAGWALVGCGQTSNQRSDAGLVEDPLALVDPFIGSGGRYFHYGSTFVGACRPHGLAKPGPDTTTEHGAAEFHHFSGYHAEDELINGFSQLHISGTGAADFGTLLLMPSAGFGPEKIREFGYRSRFDKQTERAWPGYYTVRLADTDIGVEITATERAALYRVTWATGEPAPVLILDPSHAISGCSVSDAEAGIDPAGDRVTGWVHYHGALTGRSGGFRLYFDLRLSRALSSSSGWSESVLTPGADRVAGPDVGLALGFEPSGDPLLVRVGLSYVDLAGATANLQAELPDFDFERVREEAEQAWSTELLRVRVAGGSADEQEMFYTGLYHFFLHPTLYSDADGRYLGFDRQIHVADGWDYYNDFSLWDTYRCTHSLFSLIVPERHGDMLRSLMAMYAQGGALPKWPTGLGDSGAMIGAPVEVVLAEAFIKGIAGIDWDAAYQAVVDHATRTQPYGGRTQIERYLELGYLPADEVGGSAARTLEFGVADAAVAAWARALGRAQDEAAFSARARGYVHLWDPATGFLRGKNADGSWAERGAEFNPLDWNAEYYTEGTAWQYTFLVPHDALGLAALFGSPGAMADKLEAFFATPEPDDPLKEFLPDVYYWHGNEPDLHAAYLFTQLGRPERTQHWVRQLLIDEYGTGPDGIPGNDDLGTMSAWYVFSAAGFYPNAGQSWYWVGSPIFERVVFDLGAGRSFEVRAPGASAANRYVQQARLGQAPLEQAWFDHQALLEQGVLELSLAASPSAWGR